MGSTTPTVIDITQDTELDNNDKAYTTYKAYKDTINAKKINNEAKNRADHDYDPIGTVEGDGVGGRSTPGPHDTPGLCDQGPNALCGAIKTQDTNPKTSAEEAPDLPDLRKSLSPPAVAVAPTDPGGRSRGAGAGPHGAVAKTAQSTKKMEDAQRNTKDLVTVINTRKPNVTTNAKEMTGAIDAKEMYGTTNTSLTTEGVNTRLATNKEKPYGSDFREAKEETSTEHRVSSCKTGNPSGCTWRT